MVQRQKPGNRNERLWTLLQEREAGYVMIKKDAGDRAAVKGAKGRMKTM